LQLPALSKGYETFVVQDLLIQPAAIRYRRERWVTPDGRTVVAPLPAGVDGHFGPELRRFVLAQYHQGQVTVARLVTLLDAIGIEISKRQVVWLLIDGQDRFVEEARAVLRTKRQPGLPSTIPARATRPRTASAPRSATTALPGSARPARKAGSTSSSCCAPAMVIM
jgi:hypothetical protein